MEKALVNLTNQWWFSKFYPPNFNIVSCNLKCQSWSRINIRVFDMNFRPAPNWLKSYIPQSTMMGQSYSISIEGLNHVVPKWSNWSSKVGHLVFSLDQWCVIVAYQIFWLTYIFQSFWIMVCYMWHINNQNYLWCAL